MDKLILVLYVDVGMLPDVEVEEFVKRVGSIMFSDEVKKKLDATTFVIPQRGGGTRMECINPKFIVGEEIYKEHKSKLETLNQSIDKFISDLNK